MLHQIGSGVLGPVFRTYEPQHDRLVAVKAFKLNLVPEDVERLAVALRRLVDARLTHPGIVPVLDAGLEGGTAFLAMEYVAGETLDVAFRHLAPAPLSRALPILRTMASAIDAASAAGFGHGTLHPRDVFFRAGTDDVIVSGFGVVPALETVGFKAPARRPYSAPERAAGTPADLRADVYSLGAIAHELLTRRRPAGPGEQDGGLATGVAADHRGELGRMLSTALAAEPGDRFPTATAFVDALATLDDGAVAAVPTPGPLFDQQVDDAPAAESAPNEDKEDKEDLELTPVSVLQNWETALERTAPVAVPELPLAIEPAPAPAAADATLTKPSDAPHEREKDWQFPVAAEAPPDAGLTSRDRRPLPPALFASVGVEQPPVPPFPWVPFAAAVLASATLAGVTGYQMGLRLSGPVPATAGSQSPGSSAEVKTPAPVPPATAPPPATDNAASAAATPASQPAVTPPPPVAEAPASAPPSSLVSGRLSVHSQPSGALITVNGKPRGTTPQTIRDLPLGTFTIKVARPGFVPKTQQVVLTAASPSADVTMTLVAGSGAAPKPSAAAAPKTGSVAVDTRPRGASVTIDGKAIGVTPARTSGLSVGSHAVKLELTGYKPVTTKVTIKAGTTQRLTVTLTNAGRGTAGRK